MADLLPEWLPGWLPALCKRLRVPLPPGAPPPGEDKGGRVKGIPGQPAARVVGAAGAEIWFGGLAGAAGGGGSISVHGGRREEGLCHEVQQHVLRLTHLFQKRYC